MEKTIINPKFKKVLNYIGWKVLGSLIFVLTVGTSLWAMAAFTEPTSGPAASVQDFAKNILGANNANNEFDSGSVTSNGDGSMIERVEYLQTKVNELSTKSGSTATALSAQSSNGQVFFVDATKYCADLSATAQYTIDGSSTSVTYTDWRLPSVSEAAIFANSSMSNVLIWTNTFWYDDKWVAISLYNGRAQAYFYNDVKNVRCVR